MSEILELSYKTPSRMTIRLYTRNQGGNFVELSGGGYAPQKVGVRSGQQYFKFPTATTNWQTVHGYGVAWGKFTEIRSFEYPAGSVNLKAGDQFSLALMVSYG